MNKDSSHHKFYSDDHQKRVSQKRLTGALLLLVILFIVGLVTNLPVGAVRASTAITPITTIIATAVATPIGTITPVPFQVSDLGDAPDSTNHSMALMTAYAGVTAQFPTVFDAATGLPVGPKHRNRPLRYHLGSNITNEREADTGPDADGINNIIPLTNSKNNDGADDGLALPVALPHCQTTTITYVVTVVSGGATQAYFNAWADFNRNGAWGNVFACSLGTASEWAVQNQLITLPGPGSYTFTASFLSYNPTPSKPMWFRVSVSEAPAPAADGQGITGGYTDGETEDYLLPGIIVTATVVQTPIGEATPVEH